MKRKKGSQHGIVIRLIANEKKKVNGIVIRLEQL